MDSRSESTILVAQGSLEHCRRGRPGERHLAQITAAVRQFDLLADEEAVEVLERLVGETRVEIEPNILDASFGADAEGEESRNHLGLGVGEQRLDAGADGEFEDFVAAQVVEEAERVGADQLDLAAMRDVEEHGVFAGVAILRGGVAEVRGTCQPASSVKTVPAAEVSS